MAALVDGKDEKGDFWFVNGVNPRAALAFAAGAAFPLADFAATAEIGARMVGVVGPGVQTIISPGVALARGAGVGGAVAAAAYLALNRLAPPPRVSSGGGATARSRGGAARVITADGAATGSAVDDAGIGERRADLDAQTVDRARGGAGSERSFGERWSDGSGDGPGGGDGPEDDDDDDDDASRVDRARSRLERLLEMESATPPPHDGETRHDGDADVVSPRLEDTALGASLKAELERHLERRRLRLGELRAERSARGARAVPDAAVARVQADVDALVAEIRAFEAGGPEYARGASGRLVARAEAEIARSRRAGGDDAGTTSGERLGGYLESAGEWREVSRAAAEVTKLDLEMEKLSTRAIFPTLRPIGFGRCGVRVARAPTGAPSNRGTRILPFTAPPFRRPSLLFVLAWNSYSTQQCE